MREPSMIAIASVSELFMKRARGVLAPVLGSTHSLEEYFLEDQHRIELKTYDLVVCDSVAFHQVKASEIVRYQLISEESLAKIRDRLANAEVFVSYSSVSTMSSAGMICGAYSLRFLSRTSSS